MPAGRASGSTTSPGACWTQDRFSGYIDQYSVTGLTSNPSIFDKAIASGVPVNVTLLFSAGQYQAAAEAFLRGVERRIELGLDPNVDSVASVFMSRWDAAVAGEVPAGLRNRLGLAMGLKVYQAYRQLMDSDRWQRAANAGARIQRLLWASTKTKDPASTSRARCFPERPWAERSTAACRQP